MDVELVGLLARVRNDWLTTRRAVLDAIYPPSCLCAPEVTLTSRPPFGLCDTCIAALEANDGERCSVCDLPGEQCCTPGERYRLRAPYLYGGPLKLAVAAAKFERRDDLARGLGRLLAEHPDVALLARQCDVCVPVPLSSARARTRGYNQSAIMARALGRTLGLPVRYVLKRTRNTRPQHTLDIEARRTNVTGAFVVSRRRSLGTVMLVDDVVTSGETMRAAAECLIEAGARQVIAIAAARTPRHG